MLLPSGVCRDPRLGREQWKDNKMPSACFAPLNDPLWASEGWTKDQG